MKKNNVSKIKGILLVSFITAPQFLVMSDPYNGQGSDLTRGLIGEYLYSGTFFRIYTLFYDKT
jgi:hypothetical protein